MQLCLWLLPLLFAATATGADSIAGSWINRNPDTGGDRSGGICGSLLPLTTLH
jgi:hypothetical protein